MIPLISLEKTDGHQMEEFKQVLKEEKEKMMKTKMKVNFLNKVSPQIRVHCISMMSKICSEL